MLQKSSRSKCSLFPHVEDLQALKTLKAQKTDVLKPPQNNVHTKKMGCNV